MPQGIRKINTVKGLISHGMVRCAVLAGGFGKRLDAVCDPTRNRWALAKPAAPIGTGALIDVSIQSLSKLGVKEINLLTCHLPETIRQRVGDGKIYGKDMDIREHIEDKADPLDTAGSTVNLAEMEGWRDKCELVIVASADILHEINFEQVLAGHLENRSKHNAVATIVVNPVPWNSVSRFGTVRLMDMPRREDFMGDDEKAFEDRVDNWIHGLERENACRKIIEFREKKPRSVDMNLPEEQRYRDVALSSLNNSSVYVFEASFLDFLKTMVTKKDRRVPLLPSQFRAGGPEIFSDFGKHVFKWLTEKAQLENYPIFAYILPQSKYWRDAGTGEELRKANMDLLDGRISHIGMNGLTKIEANGTHYWKAENVYIHPSAYVNRSIIGPDVVIGPNAKIIHSVVGAGIEIKEGVQMWGTVAFPKHRENTCANIIGANSQISDCLFLGGQVLPNSMFREVQIYDPYGGVAIGSLNGETKYSQP